METLYTSTGILCYESDPHKLIVSVDTGLVKYYRSLIPKYIKTNSQAYAPHISVVRHEVPFNHECWGKYQNELIEFQYSNIIQFGGMYCWLNVYSQRLTEIRLELGLSATSGLSRPPDGKCCFHCTIGNFKGINT